MKLVRVTLWNGETRLCNLNDDASLMQLWRTWRADGDAIGEAWCAHFDAISHIDLVQPAGAEHPAEEIKPDARTIPFPMSGAAPFKFPGEA